ncbi:MAG TPA: PDZ domain-containing protein [Luteimonas sp.]|nr:PDZ domain-containing protein [Luteimonas sp.]
MNTILQASLSLAVALAFAGHAAPARAQAAAPRAAPAANDKALTEARAELARAARKVAELTNKQVASDVRVERSLAARPVLGVLLAPDEGGGVRVAGVTPASGAAKAGLKAGDRITSVDGNQVLGSNGDLRMRNLRKLLGHLEAGTKTRIGYLRDGRAATADVTPAAGRHLFVFSDDGDGNAMFDRGDFDFDFDFDAMPAIAPEIRREIIRIGPDGACKGNACKAPALLSAFRWTGLNLAAVDAQLGRYFGTDRGVLVLTSGELAGLQAGDVIQRIDGKPVATPREAMAALRGKDDGAKVPIDYLRDRKPGHAQVTVPKLMPLPLPPAPPAPPAAPKAPPPPPAPPAPKAADAGVDLPAPPAPPAPPRPPVAAVAAVALVSL